MHTSKNNSLLLYTNGAAAEVIGRFRQLCTADTAESRRELCDAVAADILRYAVDYGFKRDAWQSCIVLSAITSDNPFTQVCERRETVPCTLADIARRDIGVLYELFNYSFEELEQQCETDVFSRLKAFRAHGDACVKFPEISKRLDALTAKLGRCETCESFFDTLCDFYVKYGFGNIGLNRSFRFEFKDGQTVLEPIVNFEITELSSIIGYESQKKELYDNTAAFVSGKPANNVLLYGDSGTGKSTSIKAISDCFYAEGLRMIEVYKHQIEDLPRLIAYLSRRNYRFVIYLDDLSFEENETEYKYLKAVIDGGIQSKPENVVIYATSNRRHLVRESWNDHSDLSDDDIHSSDTVEEKLSLAARFGLNIYYPKPSRDEFMSIVHGLAQKNNIGIDFKTLSDKARVWEMHHGGISGRTAAQFIADMLGNQ